jgi:TPR repeat protein
MTADKRSAVDPKTLSSVAQMPSTTSAKCTKMAAAFPRMMPKRWRKAAEQGNASAQSNLGFMYD